MQMLLEPHGVIHPCCFQTDVVLGDISKNTIEEIWNGEAMQKLRQEFMSGQPTSCKMQMQRLRCHKSSLREYSEEIRIEKIQKEAPRRLDLRLNGKCNLECIMCDVWKQPNGTYTEANFWKYGRETVFPFLKEIIVLGGEPFVQKDTFRLIDEISAVNKSCQWSFVTNGQYEVNEKFLTALDKIELRSLKISLDSVNAETYAKIRKKGQLKKALATLQKFIALKKSRTAEGRGFFVAISMCVQKQNYTELDQFITFAKMLDLEFSLPFVDVPEEHSILTLSRPERELALAEMTRLRKSFGAIQLDGIILPLQNSLL